MNLLGFEVGLNKCKSKPRTIALINIILPAIKLNGKKEIADLPGVKLK